MNIHKIKNILHIFITGPLLVYIGLVQPSQIYFYYILLALSFTIIGIFIYRLINKSLYPWIYVHLLLFSLLFFIIGYKKIIDKNVPVFLYSFLLAIGIGAIGYHSIRLIGF